MIGLWNRGRTLDYKIPIGRNSYLWRWGRPYKLNWRREPGQIFTFAYCNLNSSPYQSRESKTSKHQKTILPSLTHSRAQYLEKANAWLGFLPALAAHAVSCLHLPQPLAFGRSSPFWNVDPRRYFLVISGYILYQVTFKRLLFTDVIANECEAIPGPDPWPRPGLR